MMSRSEIQARYQATEKGKATRRRYANTTAAKEQKQATSRLYKRSPRGRYTAHKERAKLRGISWEFTFEQWWAMWEPHWENRGLGLGKFVMTRRGDVGPYSPDNCVIKTHEENSIEQCERVHGPDRKPTERKYRETQKRAAAAYNKRRGYKRHAPVRENG